MGYVFFDMQAYYESQNSMRNVWSELKKGDVGGACKQEVGGAFFARRHAVMTPD